MPPLNSSPPFLGRLKRVSSLYFDIQQPYYLSDKQTHRVFKLSILNSTVSLLAIYYGTESYGKQSPYARWVKHSLICFHLN